MYGTITIKTDQGDFELDEFKFPYGTTSQDITEKYFQECILRKITTADLSFIFDKVANKIIVGIFDKFFVSIKYNFTTTEKAKDDINNGDLTRIAYRKFLNYFLSQEFTLSVRCRCSAIDFQKVL